MSNEPSFGQGIVNDLKELRDFLCDHAIKHPGARVSEALDAWDARLARDAGRSGDVWQAGVKEGGDDKLLAEATQQTMRKP